MSYLKETAAWEDGIYQIETSDPVLGGPDGIANRPARELANRTAWLKQQLKEAEAALTAHTRSRNHPDASLSEKGFVRLSNANQSSSETEAATPKAVKIVNDRLNAVVDHAPSDLDTLNKLAQAISNNPTFSDSVTQLLSQKLAKNENGADIPDKDQFVKNLGLLETENRWSNRQIFNTLISGDLDGNAVSATTLQTARKINGVPFNGSADISVNTLVSRGRVPALSGNDQGTPGIQLYEAYNNGYPTPYGNVIHLKGASSGGEGELLMGWSGTSITGTHAPVYIRSRRDVGGAPWSAWAQFCTANELAGIPLPFPGEVPPSGWLRCNGQGFNTTAYPVLASFYPSGNLPDLRGEFIRGWDDGRKVDTGRSLLSAQDDAMQPITAKWTMDDMAAGGGIDTPLRGLIYRQRREG